MQDFSRKVRYLFVTRNRTARAEGEFAYSHRLYTHEQFEQQQLMDVKRRLLNVFFYMQLQVKFRLVDAIESHNLTRDGRTLPCVQYIASLALVEVVVYFLAVSVNLIFYVRRL
jgi:hypothetical protein